ncbi:MAG: hypothetical protein V3W04_10670 [Gammaproteobacteria bacterium]
MSIKTSVSLAIPCLAIFLFSPVQASLFHYTMSGEFNFSNIEINDSPYSESGEGYSGAAPDVQVGSQFSLSFTLDDSKTANTSNDTQFPDAISNLELSLFDYDENPYSVSVTPLAIVQQNQPGYDAWFVAISSDNVPGQVGDALVNSQNLPFLGLALSLLDSENLLSGTDLQAFDDNQFSQPGDFARLSMTWLFDPIPFIDPPGADKIFLQVDGSVNTNTIQRTAVVPLPASIWLFGSAIVGLIGLSRRKTA